MPPIPSVAAVLFVDDVARITAFYQAVARMTVLQADADHTVLEIAGWQLTVHAMPTHARTPGAVYPLREDSFIKLCFPVDRIEQARATAAALGGEVWPPTKEWDALERGFRACDGRDPEGNVFQVRQQL